MLEIVYMYQILQNCYKYSEKYIPANIFKPYLDSYIKPLSFLINLCLEQGIFPNELKIAKVMPIYKSGNKSLPSNYRPISILNIVIYQRYLKK